MITQTAFDLFLALDDRRSRLGVRGEGPPEGGSWPAVER